jgi:hypothetical protein
MKDRCDVFMEDLSRTVLIEEIPTVLIIIVVTTLPVNQ